MPCSRDQSNSGDLLLQAGEECDSGDDEHALIWCAPSCRNHRCGDGFVKRQNLFREVAGDLDFEECDDGNAEAGDGCSPNCLEEVCGNGRVDHGVACDDANDINEDACPNDCSPPYLFTQFSSGHLETCALTEAGHQVCWGHRISDQERDEGLCTNPVTRAVRIDEPPSTHVAVGRLNRCNLSAEGDLTCAGDLGAPSTILDMEVWQGEHVVATYYCATPIYPRTAPVIPQVIGVATGAMHTCALTVAGEVLCRGSQSSLGGRNRQGRTRDGRLGRWVRYRYCGGDPVELGGRQWREQECEEGPRRDEDDALDHCLGGREALPVVGLPDGVISITAGGGHNCVLSEEGRVWCWGYNGQGSLGDGTQQNRISPVEVLELPRSSMVSAGDKHTCAVSLTGEAYCWGSNQHGQLGDGTTQSRSRPVQVRNLVAVDQIAAGGQHTCSRVGSNVWCWGGNSSGEIGDGSLEARLLPVQVDGLPPVEEIRLGGGWVY